MIPAAPSTKVAALLLPTILAFAFQASLEVLHPIEEQSTAAHLHGDGVVVVDPDACDQEGHGPHFCAHSNAFAHVLQLARTAQVGVQGRTHSVAPRTFVAATLVEFLGRAPPLSND